MPIGLTGKSVIRILPVNPRVSPFSDLCASQPFQKLFHDGAGVAKEPPLKGIRII
jgi:hypothetical protein